MNSAGQNDSHNEKVNFIANKVVDIQNENINVTKRQYNRKVWVKSAIKFHLSESEANENYDFVASTFRSKYYVDFFSKKLNSLGITCVIAAQQKRSNKTIAQFYCLHSECTKEYKVQAASVLEEFSVYFCGEENHSSNGVARPLNGIARIRQRKVVSTIKSKTYQKICRDNADRSLLAEGNLQDNISAQTIHNLKSEALKLYDLDPDHIKDLTKLKKQQEEAVANKVEGAEQYIRWVVADPFVVIIFSDKQMEVLRELMRQGVKIVLHVDATGSVVAQPDGILTKVYYYVASVALSIRDEEHKLLCPIFEMISSSHDTFTIATWINLFISDFYKKYTCYPEFNDFVTDFSFAILNAASKAFNGRDLIDTINIIYENGHDPTLIAKLLGIFVHICCNHFSKTTTKDINQFFPIAQSSSTVRVFLKETLAMMFNLSTIQSLMDAYRWLSTILNSKYITEEVTSAINGLTRLAADTDENGHRTDGADTGDEGDNLDLAVEEEILTFDEPEADSMYRRSLFFQKFSSITHSGFFDDSKNLKLNNFYCLEYCQLLLKKYVAILPLWTCINSRKRFSNSNAENIFLATKDSLRDSAAEIGRIPLRASRFIRFTRNYVHATIDQFEDQIPRKNNCGRKRKAPPPVTPSTAKSKRCSATSVSQPQQFSTPTSISVTPSTAKSKRCSATSVSQPQQFSTPTSISQPQQFSTPTSISQPQQDPKLTAETSVRSSTRIRFTPLRFLHTSPLTPKFIKSPLAVNNTPKMYSPISTYLTSNSNPKSTPKSSRPWKTPSRRRGRPKLLQHMSPHSPGVFNLDSPQMENRSPMENPLINMTAEESWQPRKNPKKHTYFNGNLLKNFTQPRILSKIFDSNDKRVVKGIKLINHLYDDPSIYIKPKVKLVVARLDRKTGPLLENDDFRSLNEGYITSSCSEFLLKIFKKNNKAIQFEMEQTDQIINPTKWNENILKFEKDNFIGILHSNSYSLIIINFKKKRFSYLNPTLQSILDQTKIYFDNFKKFLKLHNESYNSNFDDEWSIHELQCSFVDLIDSGVYILNIVKEISEKNAIGKESDIMSLRKNLPHFILHNSIKMTDFCVICGMEDDPVQGSQKNLVDWNECEICKRWVHEACDKSPLLTKQYRCAICICYN